MFMTHDHHGEAGSPIPWNSFGTPVHDHPPRAQLYQGTVKLLRLKGTTIPFNDRTCRESRLDLARWCLPLILCCFMRPRKFNIYNENQLNPTVGGVFTNLSTINQHKSTNTQIIINPCFLVKLPCSPAPSALGLLPQRRWWQYHRLAPLRSRRRMLPESPGELRRRPIPAGEGFNRGHQVHSFGPKWQVPSVNI